MRTAYLVLVFAAALFARAGMPARAAMPATTSGSTAIAVALLNGSHNLGHARNTRVDLSIVLPYRHAADLPLLLRAQQDSASPYYRHFLRPAQFRDYFAPTPASYAAAARSLEAQGLNVGIFANRTVLHAWGASRAAERLFHTVINTVREPNGRLAYANVTPATMPTLLAGAHVVGLDNIVRLHAAASPYVGTAETSKGSQPLFGPDGGFGPMAIIKAQDFPVRHGYTGKNSNVADLIDGSVSDSDVAAFLHQFGIARSGPRTTPIRIDGGCTGRCSDSFQATCDAEWTLAAAPGASLLTYQIPELIPNYIVDVFNAVTSDDSANIVNFSFGACEIQVFTLELALQPIVEQAAALGISVESVALGGANDCQQPPFVLPASPADLDTLTAVGGSSTFVDTAGAQLMETGFIDSNGGASVVVPMPAYQAKTPGVDHSGRNVPMALRTK